MPPLSELPGNVNRRKFTKALVRLGFILNTTGGAGSHFKLTWPATQKSITVPKDIRKDVLYYLVKEIEATTSVTWEQIRNEL